MNSVLQTTIRSSSYVSIIKWQSPSSFIAAFPVSWSALPASNPAARHFSTGTFMSSSLDGGLSSFPSATKQREFYSISSFSLRGYGTNASHDESKNNHKNLVVYEGPFANLALRLKRISITSAVASIVGAPSLVIFGSNLPVSGQLAVAGTAIVAACGSTAALSFCFSPYIHTLEWIPVRKCNVTNDNTQIHDSPKEQVDSRQHHRHTHPQEEEAAAAADKTEFKDCQTFLLKATTRNMFSMKCETIFDPSQVKHIGDFQTYRPFCNFMVKDKHFFIHPEMLHDDELRIQLLGREKGTLVQDPTSDTTAHAKKRDPDDDFL